MTLTFPGKTSILETVELLIGETPRFDEGSGWNPVNPPKGAYITFLQGKDNSVEGAILTDLAATLYIGGKLIPQPDAALQDQFDSGEADESVIEAVTEVISNLRVLYNNISPNPHVTPTRTFRYVVPTENDFVAWIRDPGNRVDYIVETPWGPGTLTLITS